VSDDEFTEVEAGGEKNDDPIANQSGFFAWHVENGIVRASHGEQRDDQTSPFPFNVNGVSMEELLDYETRFGFVAEFSGKTIGFAEVWERMKKENELGDGRTNDSSKDSSTVSSKDSGRTDQKPKDAKKRREPRDAYFFEQYVINETWGDAGDTGIIDLDDFDDAFDLDDDDDEIDGLDLFGGELTDDDDDFTDADAVRVGAFPNPTHLRFADCPPVITHVTWPERLTLFFPNHSSPCSTAGVWTSSPKACPQRCSATFNPRLNNGGWGGAFSLMMRTTTTTVRIPGGYLKHAATGVTSSTKITKTKMTTTTTTRGKWRRFAFR